MHYPALLVFVVAFFVAVRLIASALMEQRLVCTKKDVVLRRLRFGHEIEPQRLRVVELAKVVRGVVTYTKYGPVHGLLFVGRNGETLRSLRSMPAREMQGFLHRLEDLKYPVVFDTATPLAVRLGDSPPSGLLRWL